MKKILITSIFALSILSVKAQSGTYDDIFMTNIYGKGDVSAVSERPNYHISNKLVQGKWMLDTAWWGGMNFYSAGGDIKLKSAGGTLHIAQNGNVGIGIENPTRKLTVTGDIYAGGPASLSFQDDARFTINPYDVPGSIASSVSMPQYGITAPNVSGGAELWISGFKGIRMFTAGGVKPKFIITTNGDAALQGKLEAKEVQITLSPTADFVFEETYGLPKLEDVEKHIKEKKHLPEIASAKEMEKEGVNIGEFQIKLLQKIEELTLYSIEQNKKIKSLESQNHQFKTLLERVEKLEKNTVKSNK